MLELDPLDDLAEVSGPELLRELADLLPAQGVPFPPVPPELADAVRVLGRWRFGTRPLDRPLLDIEGWVAEAVARAPATYLVFGHDGYGIAGQAIHYYLVTGPLAVFLQERLDALADTPSFPMLAAAFAALPALLDRLEQAQARGRIGGDERWVLVDSTLTRRGWARLAGAGGAPTWRDEGRDPIAGALAGLSLAAGSDNES